MKKLVTLLLVAVMTVSCFALASCNDKEESSAVSTESTASETASADESADESVDASEDASADASADESTDASTDASAGDITQTASYKYISSIDYSNGITAKISVDMEVMVMVNTVCTLGENTYIEMATTTSEGTENVKMLTKDGKSYLIDDVEKTYIVSDVEGETEDEYSVDAIFGDITYVATTAEEIDGVTYTVDNFKTISGGEDAKFYVDADGVIKLAYMDGMVVGFEITAGVIEGCFDIPVDYTETSFDISFDIEDSDDIVINDDVVE